MRNAEIGNKDFELDVLEEAYTTEHWLVRIYKVWHQNEPRPPPVWEKNVEFYLILLFLPR